MVVSNHRPLECESSALPLSQYPLEAIIHLINRIIQLIILNIFFRKVTITYTQAAIDICTILLIFMLNVNQYPKFS